METPVSDIRNHLHPEMHTPLPGYSAASQCSFYKWSESHNVVETILVLPRKNNAVKVENISVAIVNKKRWEGNFDESTVFKETLCAAGGQLMLTVSPAPPSYMGDRIPTPAPNCSPVRTCTCGKYFKCDTQFRFQFQSHTSHAMNAHEGVCMLISLLSGTYKICTHSMYSSK